MESKYVLTQDGYIEQRWVVDIKLVKLRKNQLPKCDSDYMINLNFNDCKILAEEEYGWGGEIKSRDEAWQIMHNIVRKKDWRTVEETLDEDLWDYMESNKIFVTFDLVGYALVQDKNEWQEFIRITGNYQVPVRFFIERESQQVYGMSLIPIKNDLIKAFEKANEDFRR